MPAHDVLRLVRMEQHAYGNVVSDITYDSPQDKEQLCMTSVYPYTLLYLKV